MSELGICKIKQEYIIQDPSRSLALDSISDKDKRKLSETDDSQTTPPEKQQKLSKSEKKKLRGQNKSRGPTVRPNRQIELCNTLVNLSINDEIPKCERKNCQFIHDIAKYLKIKPKDIDPVCHNYATFGQCPRGLACRFGAQHITPDGRNKVDLERSASLAHTKNQLQHELQTALRKRTYDFQVAEALIACNDNLHKIDKEAKTEEKEDAPSGAILDEDIIKLTVREKPALNWRNKLVLSPLTTVGNLPFRRICKEYGADVTCGEMAMCSSLLQGTPQEWALVKRHETEDIFGVQLCANNPHLLTKCGQLLQNEAEIDFIDLNLGCPIELVYREGGGCALLRRPRVLEACVRNLAQILSIPLTIKTRTGVYSDESVAHVLAPKFRDWGASLLTVHGRSKEQRYTKSADWAYIERVAEAAAPLPVFGNGDVFSYEDYQSALTKCPRLAGVMIGRGALVKPWIFEEIRQAKIWDISSGERFDILKKYTNYGLEHWGSDNKGVENTRRFMLEWLSFLHRYVPVGVLEAPPQKINERPPRFRGRDELETLMASTAAADWVKISEMLLGPVPEGFRFIPKHKANSYK